MDGIPPGSQKPATSCARSPARSLSLRLPPGVDPDAAGAALDRGARGRPAARRARCASPSTSGAPGWDAPPTAPWLAAALDAASGAEFGQPCRRHGRGRHDPVHGDARAAASPTRSSWSPACSARAPTPTARTSSSTWRPGAGSPRRWPTCWMPTPVGDAARADLARATTAWTDQWWDDEVGSALDAARPGRRRLSRRRSSTCCPRPPGTRSGCSSGTVTATGTSRPSPRDRARPPVRRARPGVARHVHARPRDPAAPARRPDVGSTTTPTGASSSAARLLLTLRRLGDLLPAAARTADRPAPCASRSTASTPRRTARRIPASYSNIALMQAYVEVEAGLRLGRAGWVAAGEDRARRAVARFDRHGAFDEFNSPTYHGIDLEGARPVAGPLRLGRAGRARRAGRGRAVGRRRPLVPRRAAPGRRPLHPRLRHGPRPLRRGLGAVGVGRARPRPRPAPRASTGRSPTAWTSSSDRSSRSSARWCRSEARAAPDRLHR